MNTQQPVTTDHELIAAATWVYQGQGEELNPVPDQPDAARSTVCRDEGAAVVCLRNVNGVLAEVVIDDHLLAAFRDDVQEFAD
jgi:hypothetical protein